jgi:general secretion pathway protein E
MREKLRRIVRERSLLSPERLEECLQVEAATGETLDKVILQKGYLTEIDTLRLFGEVLGIEVVDNLGDQQVPAEFVNQVPVQFARQANLVALGADGKNGHALRVAICSPFETNALDDLATMLSIEAEPILAPRIEITNLINKAYKRKADVVDEALDNLEEGELDALTAEIDSAEDILDVANKAPIIKLVNMVLFQALKMRASDVHLHPYEDRLQVRQRIDGILYDTEVIPKKVQDAVISRVKIMGKMDIAERRLPQDGRATIKLGDGEVDVRISSVPTSQGERIVMRLLDMTARVLSMEQLGLQTDDLALLRRFAHYTHGIILVTGPTGSGKTTTLYAVLSEINSAEKNVITIEDPIEYHLDGISQIQVNNKKGLTFANGLRSLMRQDPDIMMVGEIRDEETAKIATQAALTGHLVFSTLHTNDAAGAVARMLNFNVEPYLVASSVLVVIAQRLVRRICPECRESYVPEGVDLKELKELGLSIEMIPGGLLHRGKGCANCFQTGYVDRIAIYEILPLDETVKEQVMDRASAATIKKASISRGCRTLRMDGASKVRQGITTCEEVLRVTQLDMF